MESTKPAKDFVYIDVDAVNNKTNSIDKPKFILKTNAPSRATRKLHKNDILFSMVRPYLRNIALVPEEYANAIASTGFYVITSLNALFPKYIFLLMLSSYVVDGLNSFMKGENSPSINNCHIEDFLYPLPPLTEQHRIVAKVEELLPFVENYACAQNKLNKLNTEINDKLKKSILQEAIQGRLVPQIAEEGTVQELFEQIKQEKARLVKEGKLKKSVLSDSNIFRGDDNKYWEKLGKEIHCIDDEIPFEIPASWQWVRIKDIFQINPKNVAEDNCISAFIPMQKICATYGSEFYYDEVQWKTIKTGYTHFADGDVAFAKITPCFQNRKSVIFIGLPNGIGAGTTELKVMRPYGETINRWYLLYFLKSPYFIDEAQFKGTANQQRIITGYLENKLFPLPPKFEQDRIVQRIKQLASIMSR
ncbi:restriction endonuclease subunit S [Alistipes communis]|uniref:restriction endonuclease subunit S n=1 Tax=Alistipes communis TaxID=2585118 RepID=UPI0022E578B7|nr:restriction endonuclease subunit S [Alistipes communis]